MYRIDDEKTYYMMLPPNLQDTDAECFSYALSKQLEKLVRLAEKLNVWGNLGGLNSKYYDLAAACMNAQYYRTKYPDDVKLDLIKHAYEMHRFAGTQTAIDTLLDIVFEKAQFTPWYEYGGKPYRFKVLVYDMLTEDAAELFTDVLQKVKAARSILDSIEIGREAFQSLHTAARTSYSVKAPKIEVDSDGENVAKIQNCTGETTSGYTRAQKIIEQWGTTESEAVSEAHTAAVANAFSKMQKIKEDNNQDAETAANSWHEQAYTAGFLKAPKIEENNNLENTAEQVTHAASATLETHNNKA